MELARVDGVSVTLLVDNLVDPFLATAPHVGRTGWPDALRGALPRAGAAVTPQLGRPDMLVAEPGFSALVRIRQAGRVRTLLFDTGVSPRGMTENMTRLGIDPREIEVIVLSHGHWDHITGMEGLARVIGRRAMPAVLHPEFFARRRLNLPGQDPAELPVPSQAALADLGFEVTEDRRPSFVLDGAALITGEIDRRTEYERGLPGHEAWRDDAWRDDALILDDQALVLRLRDEGAFVLSGCGHAGIVNTARYALALTGETRLAALVGGFHLGGGAFDAIIAPTVDALAELSPGLLVPAHCTGWKARHALAARMPDAYVPSAVGTTITF